MTNLNKTSLNRRIRKLAKGYGFKDGVLERLIANLILIKVLKLELTDGNEFLIKGGTSFLLRLPSSDARATCILDVSQDELKMANQHSAIRVSKEVRSILEDLNFSELSDVLLISTEYQLAQKIHACTEPGSRRGHDLYDICVVLDRLNVDMSALSNLVERVFAFRKTHSLTPIFDPGADFRMAFEGQTKHLEPALDYQAATQELRGLLALMCAR